MTNQAIEITKNTKESLFNLKVKYQKAIKNLEVSSLCALLYSNAPTPYGILFDELFDRGLFKTIEQFENTFEYFVDAYEAA